MSAEDAVATIYCSEVRIMPENLKNNEKISQNSVDRAICLGVNYICIKVIILLPLGRMSSSRSRKRDLSTLTIMSKRATMPVHRRSGSLR